MMARHKTILEDIIEYRGFEIGYDVYDGVYVVSKNLSDNRHHKYQVATIDEGIEFINDVLLDTTRVSAQRSNYYKNTEKRDTEVEPQRYLLLITIT